MSTENSNSIRLFDDTYKIIREGKKQLEGHPNLRNVAHLLIKAGAEAKGIKLETKKN